MSAAQVTRLRKAARQVAKMAGQALSATEAVQIGNWLDQAADRIAVLQDALDPFGDLGEQLRRAEMRGGWSAEIPATQKIFGFWGVTVTAGAIRNAARACAISRNSPEAPDAKTPQPQAPQGLALDRLPVL